MRRQLRSCAALEVRHYTPLIIACERVQAAGDGIAARVLASLSAPGDIVVPVRLAQRGLAGVWRSIPIWPLAPRLASHSAWSFATRTIILLDTPSFF